MILLELSAGSTQVLFSPEQFIIELISECSDVTFDGSEVSEQRHSSSTVITIIDNSTKIYCQRRKLTKAERKVTLTNQTHKN